MDCVQAISGKHCNDGVFKNFEFNNLSLKKHTAFSNAEEILVYRKKLKCGGDVSGFIRYCYEYSKTVRCVVSITSLNVYLRQCTLNYIHDKYDINFERKCNLKTCAIKETVQVYIDIEIDRL